MYYIIMPIQSILEGNQSPEANFKTRAEAARALCLDENIKDLLLYGTAQTRYILQTDMEVVMATSTRDLTYELMDLNRTEYCITNLTEMPARGDYGGYRNSRGSRIGVAHFGYEPEIDGEIEDQFRVEIRKLDQEELRQQMLGKSAEDVAMATQVQYEIDLTSSRTRMEYVEGKGKFTRHRERVSNQNGLRIEIDKDGKVLGLKSISIFGNTPHTADLPYNDSLSLEELIPHMEYITSASEEKARR